MTTTGERLVTLSELPGVETAMTHFVAIDTSGGEGPGGTVLVGEVFVTLEDELVGAMADEGLVGVIEEPEPITVEPDIEIDIEDDGITGETC